MNPLRPNPSAIREAVRVLDADGVVMYPTESSYALGVNALRETAISKIFEAKQRSLGRSIPVIVSDLRMWRKYACLDETAEILVREFMPGPLTLALRKRTSVPDLLNPLAIAARIPGHPVALALVRAAKYPITSTSANISGAPPVFSPKTAPRVLRSAIDLVLDVGTLRRRKPSTIVDFTIRGQPSVTRSGAISASAILRVLAQRRGER